MDCGGLAYRLAHVIFSSSNCRLVLHDHVSSCLLRRCNSIIMIRMYVAAIFQLKETDHFADLWIDVSVILLTVRNRLSWSQRPRGLRRRSAAVRLLRSWVRIPPGARMFVCCECCVLSGRGLCDELITRPEESYRLWCVIVCDLETPRMRRPWPALGRSTIGKKNGLRDCGLV